MKTKIAILEPLKMLSKSMPLLLNQHENLDVVVHSDNKEDFKNNISLLHFSPDIILFDIHQAGNNCISTINWLKKNHPDSKIIAIGVHAKYMPVYDFCIAGCIAYFGLDLDEYTFCKGIEMVHQGTFKSNQENFIDSESLYKLLKFNGCKLAKLTSVQRDTFENICSTLTIQQIATSMKITKSTVNFHIAQIGLLFSVIGRSKLKKVFIELGY